MRSLRHANQQVFINWAAIVFSFNQDHLSVIASKAQELGIDGLQLTKSTKFGSKYGAAYNGDQDTLEPRTEWISSSHRYERSMINISGRIMTNQDYLEHNRQQYVKIKEQYKDQPIVPMCEIGNRGLYVNAEGVLFPCSWTSFPYHSLSDGNKTIKWEDSFFAQYRDRMNLRTRSLEEITQDPLWNLCSRGWSDSSKSWVECSQKCNQSLVDEDYSVGWLTN
jgi:MoaA/NifB/PqqE/SkfB family radical SAM enzyme